MATSKVKKPGGWQKIENAVTYETGWTDRTPGSDGQETEVYESDYFFYVFIRAKWTGSGTSGITICTLVLPDVVRNTYGIATIGGETGQAFYSSGTSSLRLIIGVNQNTEVIGNIIIPKD